MTTEPTLVRILRANGVRWEPSDLAPYIAPSGPAASQRRSKNGHHSDTGPLRFDTDAEPPAEKFAELMADRKFRATWERQRTDLQDQSASGYDLSLATRAAAAGWTDQEIVNLIIAARRKHGADLDKVTRVDYLARTIGQARDTAAHMHTRHRNGHHDAPEDTPLTTMVTPQWPGPLDRKALYGLAGKVVRTIEPHTEADPVALLFQLLVAFGSAVGRGPHFLAEADRHFTNLFVVLVGTTAKGRKGTSFGHIRRLFRVVDPVWEGKRVEFGLSSGEGLIYAVRDPHEEQEPIRKNGRVEGYQTVIVDAGVTDKRLLVSEGEFASTLKVMSREGNTLSAIIRHAWDGGDLHTLTKNPMCATGAHISVIGHITKDELLRYLTTTEAANGFANRHLWICTRRSKVLPDGGNLAETDLHTLADALTAAVAHARTIGEMRRDSAARDLWHTVYPALSEGKPGLLGAVIARAEAQVMRLACVYALLDASPLVRLEHLEAALAAWDYVETSTHYIFGTTLGDPVADAILAALRAAPNGLTRTEIRDLFKRHKGAEEIDRALRTLEEHGLAYVVREVTGGRDAERWYAKMPSATKATNATEVPN